MIKEEDRVIKTVDKEGKEIELFIKPPDYQINALCDVEYKKSWTNALSLGVKTHKFIAEIFNKEGIWTEEHEKELTKLNAEIAYYTVVLQKFIDQKKDEDAEQTAIELAKKRNRAFALSDLRNESYVNSCDGIANEIRMESYIAYATVYNNDKDKRYFKDYEDFKNRRTEKAAIDIFASYMAMITDENVKYLDSLPEAKYLHDVGVLSNEKKYFKDATKELKKVAKPKKKKKKKVTKKKVSKSKGK